MNEHDKTYASHRCRDQLPALGKLYLVRRHGWLFTARCIQGLTSRLWIAHVPSCAVEDQPVTIEVDDRWWPLEEVRILRRAPP